MGRIVRHGALPVGGTKGHPELDPAGHSQMPGTNVAMTSGETGAYVEGQVSRDRYHCGGGKRVEEGGRVVISDGGIWWYLLHPGVKGR